MRELCTFEEEEEEEDEKEEKKEEELSCDMWLSQGIDIR